MIIHKLYEKDVWTRGVIDRLEEIAPVTVVRGNADKEWAEYIPETATVELLGNKICVIHNKGKISDDLAESICRMYLTHPGVDVAGIIQRIS